MADIDTLSLQLMDWVKDKYKSCSSEKLKALTTGSAKSASIDEDVLLIACEQAIAFLADAFRYNPLNLQFFDSYYIKAQSTRMVIAILEDQKDSKRKRVSNILDEVFKSIEKNTSGVICYENKAGDFWDDVVVK